MFYRITFIILFVFLFHSAFMWTPEKVANLSVEELENAFEKGEITTKDLNSYDEKTIESPLSISVEQNNTNLTKMLLDLGADPKIEQKETWVIYSHKTPVIHQIIRTSKKLNDSLKILLTHDNTDINQKNEEEMTILDRAITEWKFDISNLLMELKAITTLEEKIEHYTEIFKNDSISTSQIEEAKMAYNIAHAYHNANKEAQEFIKLKQELPEYDSQGFPFICYATIKGDEALLKKLINKYDINAKDNNGNTAIIFACIAENYDFVDILLEHNADPNINNLLGYNALTFSIKKSSMPNDNFDFHLKLVKHGANPQSHYFGRNLLHLLDTNNPNPETIQQWLDLGVDIDQIDYDTYKSPFDKIFTRGKNKEIDSLLINKTKDPLYELVIKELKNQPTQHFRQDDQTIYIGLLASQYANLAIPVGRKIMDKYKNVQVRIITPAAINETFIKQFNGLILPGSADNFPYEKDKFNLDDLNPETMLPIETLYQQIIDIANQNYIPTIGICGGNQHIALYNNESLQPVANYTQSYHEKHKGIFVPSSAVHFMILTQSEQKKASEKGYLPTIITPIETNHHYAAINKLINLKIGTKSEEGVTQSVYDNFKFIGTQFHIEQFYINQIVTRQQTYIDNFATLCKDNNQGLIFAKKHNIDPLIVLKHIDNKQKEILDKLEEYAQNNPTNEIITENYQSIMENLQTHKLPIWDSNKCIKGLFQFSDYYDLHSLLQKND